MATMVLVDVEARGQSPFSGEMTEFWGSCTKC